jgi:murein DD-endopeptidase MepM/ murein hydrolase activator NlpD
MRIRLFAAFVFGFAAGMAALAALLWTTGSLNRPVAASAAARQTASAMPNAGADPANGRGAGLEAGATKLAMPIAGVDPANLTDTFYETRNGHPHEALDISAARGTPVLAVDDGQVAKLFTSQQGGLTVYQFDNTGGLCYYYAHLDHYADGLKEGAILRRGEVLGYVGSTGNASPDAPHLHFAVFRLGPERQWWNGTAIDPLPLLLGNAAP